MFAHLTQRFSRPGTHEQDTDLNVVPGDVVRRQISYNHPKKTPKVEYVVHDALLVTEVTNHHIVTEDRNHEHQRWTRDGYALEHTPKTSRIFAVQRPRTATED